MKNQLALTNLIPRPGGFGRAVALAAACLAAAVSNGQTTIPTTTVPSTFVLPSSAADTGQPGFVWRVHEVATGQPNDNARTEAELAGLLGDNVADPNAQGTAIGPANPANPSTAPIAFQISGVINMSVGYGAFGGNFTPDDPMPGLPGLTGSYENAAAEVLTWLDLPAGTTILGVNSDDGFRMTLGGANPNDQFGVKVGEFNGGRPAGDTTFSVTITRAGLYAARCTWENGCCGGSLEIYSINGSGNKVLLNDTSNGGVRAYRSATTPARASAQQVSPAPGGAARADAPITVILVDGASPINPSTVKLSIDGTAVTPIKSKTGNVTTTTYTRPSFYLPGLHSVAFTYTEAGSPVTVNWTFTTLHYQGPNGNLYEFVERSNISWGDAEAAAEQRTFGCAHGHLVTLNSAEEDVFVELLRQEYVAAGVVPAGEVWAGGYQLPNQATPAEGWFWVNNEGPIPSSDGGSIYANWNQASSEPNDCCNTYGIEDNEENFLGLGYFGPGSGWIDDDVNHGNIVGYAVEYEVQAVTVDIQSGGSGNAIDLKSSGKIAVEVQSSSTFKASTINPATVTFGPAGTEAVPVDSSLTHGNTVLLCHFNIQDLGLMCSDTILRLRANTYQGCPVGGAVSVAPFNCPGYALAVEGMLDVNHLTDVYLQVTPILPGGKAPTVAKNIVLKSFDMFGHLRWTKTLQNTPLASNSGGTTLADLQYTDMEHGQKVKAQMLITDSASGATQVLRQQGRVLFRPDLAVSGVTAPPQARTYQIVNIFASVKELKGDLGATANVYLKDGGNVIDVVNNIVLTPFGSVGVVFSTMFQSEGAHQMTLVIGDVTPGDYDSSNNSQSFTIQVVQPPLQPTSYYASYSYYSQDTYEVVENPYSITTYHDQYANEYTSETLYIPAAFQFPLERVLLTISGDGVQKDSFDLSNIAATSGYSYPCYSVSTASGYLGDNVYAYIESDQNTCGGSSQTYATFSKYAYSDVYFSSYYDKYWGTTTPYSSSSGDGTFLNAVNSVTTRFVVQGNAGAFGGNGNCGVLSAYPYNYPFDYYEYDYNDGLYDEHVTGTTQGNSVYGANSDVTSP